MIFQLNNSFFNNNKTLFSYCIVIVTSSFPFAKNCKCLFFIAEFQFVLFYGSSTFLNFFVITIFYFLNSLELNIPLFMKLDFFSFFFFCFLGPHSRHIEVPRLGVDLELQLPGCTTASTPPDLSQVYNLHHSSRQCSILNQLSEAGHQTRNLMVPSWIHFLCSTMGTPWRFFFVFS